MKIGLCRNIKYLFKLSSPNACVGDLAALGAVSHWIPDPRNKHGHSGMTGTGS